MVTSSQLFKDLNFLIVASNANELKKTQDTVLLLESHCCHSCKVYDHDSEDAQIDRADIKSWFINKYGITNPVHFIISESTDFPFYYVSAFDFLIPVVTLEWVHMCITTRKHVRISAFSPDQRHIFKNFQIYLSREAFTKHEHLFYSEIVNALGGSCVDFLSNKTTHLVTKTPQDNGIKAVVNFNKPNIIKFVLPTWIMQSFKNLKIATEKEHLISPTDKLESIEENSQALWTTTLESSFAQPVPFLQNHTIILGMDLFLSKELYTYLIDFLESNGAIVIRHLDESDIENRGADVYIGSTNKSKEFEIASNLSMDLGNMLWLFHMWSFKSYVRPKEKLIFGPSKKKVFDPSQLIVSYSNYFGRQRTYIQRLTEILGGHSTPELSRKNTHLISQFSFGKKYETAKAWGGSCCIANHLWLESCYEKERKVDPKEAIFCEFPVPGGLIRGPSQRHIHIGHANDFDEEKSSSFRDGFASNTFHEGDQTDNINVTAEARNSRENLSTESAHSAIQDPLNPQLSLDAQIKEASVAKDAQKNSELPSAISGEDPDPFEGPNLDDFNKLVEEDISSKELPSRGIKEKETPEVEKTEETIKTPDGGDEELLHENEEATRSETSRTSTPMHELSIEEVQLNQIEDRSERTEQPSNSTVVSSHSIERSNLNDVTANPSPPLRDPSSSPALLSSGGSRRAAKAKAAQRLHEDIESLNQFQRNSKRKKTGSLLPEELAILEMQKTLDRNAKEIINKFFGYEMTGKSGTDDSSIGQVNNKKQLYQINAVCTGSPRVLSKLDLAILRLLGITIYDEITPENVKKLNAVIAPKKMRTAKFLISFSFHPLKYAIRPEFLDDLLSIVRKGRAEDPNFILDPTDFQIADIDQGKIQKLTSLPKKVFERALITKINLINDIPGGVDIISSILKSHGVKDIKTIPHTQMSKLTAESFISNDTFDVKRKADSIVPDYVFIVTKSAQVKQFKKIFKSSDCIALAVEWNWCISCIFDLTVNYQDRKHIVYQTGL